MCEIRSCDGSWTDSCEATEQYVLAMLSDQDPADVAGYAGALRSAESGSEEAEHNHWKIIVGPLCQPRDGTGPIRTVFRNDNGEAGPVVPLCTGRPLHVRMTKAGERLLEKTPAPCRRRPMFSSLNECRAGAGVLQVAYQGFLAPKMSCQFYSTRAKSVLRSSVG